MWPIKFSLCAVLLVSQVQSQGGERCYTPNRQVGNCLPYQTCPSILRLYSQNQSREVVNFIVQSQRNCGNRNYNGDPLLCCLDPPPRPTYQTTTPPPVFTTQPTPSPTTSAPLVQSNCAGPDGLPGQCIGLGNCPVLLNPYASDRGNPVLLQFIRDSNAACNYVQPNVCCPINGAQPRFPNTPTNPITQPPPTPSRISARLLTPEDGCGFSNVTITRVVGGVPAKLGAWPWMALLGYTDRLGETAFKCGGSLITTRHILTAAHCIRSDLTTVRLGEHDLSKEGESLASEYKVKRVETHPNYDKKDGHSDMAILVLDRDAELNRFVRPICLPISEPILSKNYVGYTPFVAGWGRTQEGGKSSDILQQVQLPIVSNEVCKKSYDSIGRLFTEKQFDNSVLCAGYPQGGKDSCQGDSGGPLMSPTNVNGVFHFYQLGVVSYGIGCARENVYGVYSSTQRFMNWIRDTVKQPV